jgi:hypothetical protein
MDGIYDLAEWCVKYFDQHYLYWIDNIFLDGVEFKVFVTRTTHIYAMRLRPTFTDESDDMHNNSEIVMCQQEINVNSPQESFIEMFTTFKKLLHTTHFALHCEMERQNIVVIRKYDKHEYKLKLDFLKSIEHEGVCYVCQEPALNTEHTSGCRHTIHLSCLYQMSKRFPKYVCGICKKGTEWEFMFDEIVDMN